MKAWIEAGWLAVEDGRQLPLTMEACRGLRAELGAALEASADLEDWARAQSRRRTPLQIHAPELAARIGSRPYQVTGAARIAAQPYLGVLDDPGLGKTAQSLAGLIESGAWEGRHLVIAPKSAVMLTWPDEIQQWTDGQVFQAVGTKAQKRRAVEQFLAARHGARFLLTNPETLRTVSRRYCPKCERWVDAAPRVITSEHVGQGHKTPWTVYSHELPELMGIEFDSVIADEVHRYMLGMRTAPPQKSQVLEGLKRLQSRRRIAMTGTPFKGKEHNVFGILHWLDPKEFSSFWSGFLERYFEVVDNGFGNEVQGLNVDREAEFGALLDRMFLRRSRTEVRADLPDNLHLVHWVPLAGEHRRQYEAMEIDGYVRMEELLLSGLGVLSELSRLRRMAFGAFDYRAQVMTPISSPKVDMLIELLAERGLTQRGVQFGDRKFIVASQFTEDLEWVGEQLHAQGIATMAITGKVVGKHRKAAKDAFQAPYHPETNPIRVLLLNTQAGGVSITLDAQCDEMFILDELLEDDMVQLRGRIDNRGDRVAVRTFHYLRTRDTVDERIARENLATALMQGHLLDGRRGVEFEHKLRGREG